MSKTVKHHKLDCIDFTTSLKESSLPVLGAALQFARTHSTLPKAINQTQMYERVEAMVGSELRRLRGADPSAESFNNKTVSKIEKGSTVVFSRDTRLRCWGLILWVYCKSLRIDLNRMKALYHAYRRVYDVGSWEQPDRLKTALEVSIHSLPIIDTVLADNSEIHRLSQFYIVDRALAVTPFTSDYRFDLDVVFHSNPIDMLVENEDLDLVIGSDIRIYQKHKRNIPIHDYARFLEVARLSDNRPVMFSVFFDRSKLKGSSNAKLRKDLELGKSDTYKLYQSGTAYSILIKTLHKLRGNGAAKIFVTEDSPASVAFQAFRDSFPEEEKALIASCESEIFNRDIESSECFDFSQILDEYDEKESVMFFGWDPLLEQVEKALRRGGSASLVRLDFRMDRLLPLKTHSRVALSVYARRSVVGEKSQQITDFILALDGAIKRFNRIIRNDEAHLDETLELDAKTLSMDVKRCCQIHRGVIDSFKTYFHGDYVSLVDGQVSSSSA